MSTHRKVQRWIDRDLLGELPATKLERLHDHLRSCESCRLFYDQGVALFRSLEQQPVSSAELDQVGRWLGHGSEAPRRRRWPRPAAAASLALACSLALVVALLPLIDSWRVKGGGDAALALEVLCGGRGQALRAGAEQHCALDRDMTFAYRIDSSVPDDGTMLTLFGIGEAGDVLYYAPTPDGASALSAGVGSWQPAGIALQVGVNHEAGRLTVYALVSESEPSLSDIDAWAEVLQQQGPAAVGDEPWHLRLPTHLIGSLCPEASACLSAEQTLQLHEVIP